MYPEITEDGIKGTLEHFKAVGPSDIHSLQPEYKLLLASPADTAKAICESLHGLDWSQKNYMRLTW